MHVSGDFCDALLPVEPSNVVRLRCDHLVEDVVLHEEQRVALDRAAHLLCLDVIESRLHGRLLRLTHHIVRRLIDLLLVRLVHFLRYCAALMPDLDLSSQLRDVAIGAARARHCIPRLDSCLASGHEGIFQRIRLF